MTSRAFGAEPRCDRDARPPYQLGRPVTPRRCDQDARPPMPVRTSRPHRPSGQEPLRTRPPVRRGPAVVPVAVRDGQQEHRTALPPARCRRARCRPDRRWGCCGVGGRRENPGHVPSLVLPDHRGRSGSSERCRSCRARRRLAVPAVTAGRCTSSGGGPGSVIRRTGRRSTAPVRDTATRPAVRGSPTRRSGRPSCPAVR